MPVKTLNDLLVTELKDLLDMEHQIIKALPKVIKAATDKELVATLKAHLTETHMHVKRVEQAFGYLGLKPARKSCVGMKGVLKEGEEIIKVKIREENVRDAALISAAQRVEHYEIAGYGCVIAFAKQLGFSEIAELLEQTLLEEKKADVLLTSIAESSVNPAAAEQNYKGQPVEHTSMAGVR